MTNSCSVTDNNPIKHLCTQGQVAPQPRKMSIWWQQRSSISNSAVKTPGLSVPSHFCPLASHLSPECFPSPLRILYACGSVCVRDPMDGQTSLSTGFSRQEYWSGLPSPSPGDLPDRGIEPMPPAVAGDSSPLCHLGSPCGF